MKLEPSPPGTNAVMEAYGWQSGRWLDPVRAAALHEAVQVRHQSIDEVLRVAERFERWLAGTDEDSP